MISLFRNTLLLLAFMGAHAVANAETPPNVILLMGDDHGWDEVAYNGHPHLHTLSLIHI